MAYPPLSETDTGSRQMSVPFPTPNFSHYEVAIKPAVLSFARMLAKASAVSMF